jgi:hypothetical protein
VDFKPDSLPVFCVDNCIYHTCRNMQEALLSGIPELRKFCYSIPAKAQFRSAHHYVATKLSSLISCLELWIGSARDPGLRSLANRVSTTALSGVMTLYEILFGVLLMPFRFHALGAFEARWQSAVEDAFDDAVNGYGMLVTTTGDLWFVLKTKMRTSRPSPTAPLQPHTAGTE